jgi:hypothetical protein
LAEGYSCYLNYGENDTNRKEPMAKNNKHPITPITAKPVANPEQLTRDIESYLADKQTAIAESIDQLLRHKKEIDRKAEESKRLVDEQADKLNELYHKATGRYYLSSGNAGSNGANGVHGGRRSIDELQADAKAIFEFVQTKGKEGVSGAEIRAQFPRVSGSIKAFVKKYTGADLKTEGLKVSMRYFGE